MLRYKVTNHIEDEKEVVIEIEEEFTNTLLHGLNITVEDDKGFLVNASLSYTQVLDLYKMLTEKICSTQIQMLDIIKNKR